MRQLFLVCTLFLAGIPLTVGAKTELWVYTSIYKEFIAPIEQAFEKKYPNVDVMVFQAGSEKIQAKVEAEILAKKIQADVLLTSDPFWPQALKKRQLVEIPTNRTGIETNYYSLMVLIAHKSVPIDQRPKSFQDLVKPQFKGQIHMGSPLESGTTFSSVAYLKNKYSWKFFEQLRDNKINSQGGNSAVIQKVESGEKKFGIVLLENALAAIKRGSPLEIIYPEDGSIPIPSVQFIVKNSPRLKEAQEFSNFILSPEGQKLLRNGFMYPADKKLPPPEGAKPFAEVTKKSTVWNDALFEEISREADQIKRKFSEFILE